MNFSFIIRKANGLDLKRIMEIMNTVQNSIKQKEWFVPDNEEYVYRHLSHDGFIIVAEREDKICGFFLVHIPGKGHENMGYDINLPPNKLEKVAHMDSVAILPEFRGNHLQSLLLKQAECILKSKGFTCFLATVHPENKYSLQNFLSSGYGVKKTVKKYGGLIRYILFKEIKQEKF